MTKTIKRLINVTCLIDAINDELYMDESTKAAFRSIVYQQPLIDAVPVVHGRWIEGRSIREEDGGGHIYHCSECGDWYHNFVPNCCPNCGAKMDGAVSDG